ncbi:cell wall hydrolase [Pontixanthobacter sp.]|uniref:cell wall hydrolase n=1 Tax=Pontixanthobacter sp. TaxID=2792078 RepID=UPI003C7BA814
MTDSAPLSAIERTARFQARMSQKSAAAATPLRQRMSTAQLAGTIAAGISAFTGIQHSGRRVAALAIAFAVPAMAAAAEWEASDTGEPAAGLTAKVVAMPFEQSGNSFPGSAFYYLEDAPRAALDLDNTSLAVFDMSGTGESEASELAAASNAGPAARAFMARGAGLSQARALQCMTNAIYYEAASEATAGQRAVAQVVLNRVAHPSYPNSVCGVVFQGSERRTGCQFSFTCDGSMQRTPGSGAWAKAQRVAQDSLSGQVYEPVGLATHYHTVWIYPYWAPSLDHIGTIGAHRFYKFNGSAGKPSAFRARYAGNEPAARRNSRSASGAVAGDASAPDPLELEKAFEDARLKAVAETQRSAPKAPAPAYSAQIQQRGGDQIFEAENLPQSGGVRPEYANSGRWINDPGKTQ